MHRRRMLQLSAGLMLGSSRLAAADGDVSSFSRMMTAFLARHDVPGAALAVARRGRLVFAGGFGYADAEKTELVRPAALFRIASVSKPLTAVAVLQLVERGKLTLDDAVLDRMPPFPDAITDPRWKAITVRQCLQHTGGWDRDRSFDPIGRPAAIAKKLGTGLPVTPEHVVRYMLGRKLDFAPGARHAYSNLGYLVLGRVIEAVTGRRYEEYVRTDVLAPLGVTAPRLGRALLADRAAGEVKYHDPKRAAGPSLYPAKAGRVPVVYGAMNLEAFEAHGGWIASAVDLVKFAAAFDEPAKCPILGAKMIAEMFARPAGLAGSTFLGKPRDLYYGCGWCVRPAGPGQANVWHPGGIPGTEALLVRRWDGLTWAVLFNASAAESLVGMIDAPVHEAADAVKAWPTGDLFGMYLK